MTRLIDADALCEEFKKRQRAALRWKEGAILDDDEERKIRADAILTFLSEVKLTIDNVPTVEAVEFEYHSKLVKQAYQKGKETRHQGEWIDKGIYYECPFCHAGYMKSICEKALDLSKMNFCFNCGADIREADNEHIQ